MAKNVSNAAVHLYEGEDMPNVTEIEENVTAKTPEVRSEAQQASSAKAPAAKKSGIRKLILPAIIIAAIAGGGYEGYQWWTNGRFMVSTDDAYIGGDIATVAPKVTGYVNKVDVKANQYVKAGDTLVTLDNGDYKIALEQAQAQLVSQELSVKSIDAQLAVADAALASAKARKQASEAALHGATLTQQRSSDLQKKNFASNSTLDSANVALEQAQADMLSSDATIQSAQANIDATKAQRDQAESVVKSLQLAVDKAKRDLSFTVLKAPYDGIVGNLSVQEGDFVTPGLRLAAVVPSDALYIDANFKETQIADIVPGQKVGISVDALGDKEIEGTVLSISPASGSVFSLLPAENATGNFTKITQRLPVRISLPKEALATHRLMAGLSVVVDVDTRTTPNAQK
jgi:membrane fusion protein, multidrug efflux system